MTDIEYKDPRTVPHESQGERDSRLRLTELLARTPIPPEYLIDNLPVYLRRPQLADLLAMDALYRRIVEVPGVIMEFGVLHGRHLAAFTALRSIYEPCNSLRRVIGFDTFTGFPDVSEIDRATPSAVAGRFAVPEDEVDHLRQVLAAHEANVALAYIDLDLYEPTPETLHALRPHLAKGGYGYRSGIREFMRNHLHGKVADLTALMRPGPGDLIVDIGRRPGPARRRT